MSTHLGNGKTRFLNMASYNKSLRAHKQRRYTMEAAFLFESLQAANCRCFHLSAAMCVQHRRETLQALQSALDKPSADNRQKVVCVSTQVIEAGVDISFQRVIRLSAGMDSVVQAAGRCNRHAEQKKPAPVRLIRCTDERLRGLDDIVRGQNATTCLLYTSDAADG